ncbi:unnamed protein product [Chrysoparadoxa australica]
MCQLLGMSCNVPTDFAFSFRGFRERGGKTDKHIHGWGVAFYEGSGCRCYIDLEPAATSPIANLICNYPIKTLNLIAHVRLATQGKVQLENVHPFQREMWGQYWVFAHNGDVPRAQYIIREGKEAGLQRRYSPVGDTDSEACFCLFLNDLMETYPDGYPGLPAIYRTVKKTWKGLCGAATESGDSSHVGGSDPSVPEHQQPIFNFLMSNGETLLAGCWPGSRPGSITWNSLFYTVREFPFPQVSLSDCDYTVDFAKLAKPKDRVTVLATAPLTKNEQWKEMAKGELSAFVHGLAYTSEEECQKYEEAETLALLASNRTENDAAVEDSLAGNRDASFPVVMPKHARAGATFEAAAAFGLPPTLSM